MLEGLASWGCGRGCWYNHRPESHHRLRKSNRASTNHDVMKTLMCEGPNQGVRCTQAVSSHCNHTCMPDSRRITDIHALQRRDQFGGVTQAHFLTRPTAPQVMVGAPHGGSGTSAALQECLSATRNASVPLRLGPFRFANRRLLTARQEHKMRSSGARVLRKTSNGLEARA